jgi:hypothetical protein
MSKRTCFEKGGLMPGLHPSVLQKGDIVFFAPASRGDMTDFNQMAAKVQSWPYPTDKPWYHVAVAVGGSQIVDFPPTTHDGTPALWKEKLRTRRLRADHNIVLSALRLPDSTRRTALANKAAAMDGVSYAIPGLLAFAAATQARLFAGKSARARLFQFAFGFEKVASASDHGYTCVTAVTAAIDQAGITLTVVQPPVPKPAGLPGVLKKSVESLYAQIQRRSTAQPPGHPAKHLIRPAAIEKAYGMSSGIHAAAPGNFFTTTSAYVEALRAIMVTYAQSANPQYDDGYLINQGKGVNRTNPRSWTVSPAMLHDALIKRGATEV